MRFLASEIEDVIEGRITSTHRVRQNGDHAVYKPTWGSLLGIREPIIIQVVRGKRTAWYLGNDYPINTRWGAEVYGWIRITSIETDVDEGEWVLVFKAVVPLWMRRGKP